MYNTLGDCYEYINVTDYCASGNASIGVIEALRNIENGDTLFFRQGSIIFIKIFSTHKVCHMTNTDFFKSPDKYFAIEIDDKRYYNRRLQFNFCYPR